jgi:hypothetical protein
MNNQIDKYIKNEADMWNAWIESMNTSLQIARDSRLRLLRENALYYSVCLLLRRKLGYTNEVVIDVSSSIDEFEETLQFEQLAISLSPDEDGKHIRIRFTPKFPSYEQKELGGNDANL